MAGRQARETGNPATKSPTGCQRHNGRNRYWKELNRRLGSKLDMTIVTEAGSQACFVLESEHARAWVDDRGVAWIQEIELPVVGRLRIVRAAKFDESALATARSFSFRRRTLDRR